MDGRKIVANAEMIVPLGVVVDALGVAQDSKGTYEGNVKTSLSFGLVGGCVESVACVRGNSLDVDARLSEDFPDDPARLVEIVRSDIAEQAEKELKEFQEQQRRMIHNVIARVALKSGLISAGTTGLSVATVVLGKSGNEWSAATGVGVLVGFGMFKMVGFGQEKPAKVRRWLNQDEAVSVAKRDVLASIIHRASAAGKIVQSARSLEVNQDQPPVGTDAQEV